MLKDFRPFAPQFLQILEEYFIAFLILKNGLLLKFKEKAININILHFRFDTTKIIKDH